MHRAAATGISLGKMVDYLLSFWSLSVVELSHPARRLSAPQEAHRTSAGMPIVPIWRFYPAYAVEFTVKHARMAVVLARLLLLRRRLKCDPEARNYRDPGINADADEKLGTLGMFQVSQSRHAAAEKAKQVRRQARAMRESRRRGSRQ